VPKFFAYSAFPGEGWSAQKLI